MPKKRSYSCLDQLRSELNKISPNVKNKAKGDDPCWDGYEMVGKKKKGGKTVPNCVPKKNKKKMQKLNDGSVDMDYHQQEIMKGDAVGDPTPRLNLMNQLSADHDLAEAHPVANFIKNDLNNGLSHFTNPTWKVIHSISYGNHGIPNHASSHYFNLFDSNIKQLEKIPGFHESHGNNIKNLRQEAVRQLYNGGRLSYALIAQMGKYAVVPDKYRFDDLGKIESHRKTELPGGTTLHLNEYSDGSHVLSQREGDELTNHEFFDNIQLFKNKYPDLYEEFFPSNPIKEYSYKPPEYKKFGDEATGKTLGVELESIVPHGSDPISTANSVVKSLGKDFSYLKRDGSLYGGAGSFEIVTHPATLEEQKKRWSNLFNKIKPMGDGSIRLESDTHECTGLHVHLDRSKLSNRSIGQMVRFINAPGTRNYIRELAGRLSHYAKIQGKKTVDKPGLKDKDRYKAVNLTNDKTIEFRIFKGTVDPFRFNSVLEFVDALSKFATGEKGRDQDFENPDAFIQYVKDNVKSYPHLDTFHDIYWEGKKKKITEREEKKKSKIKNSRPIQAAGSPMMLSVSLVWSKKNKTKKKKKMQRPIQFKQTKQEQRSLTSLSNAIARLHSANERYYRDELAQVLARTGLKPHRIHSVLHDTPKSTKPAVAASILRKVRPEQADYAAAWHGMLAKQPAMMIFHSHPEGPDSLYRLKIPFQPEPIRQLLNDLGIQSRILIPRDEHTETLIHDPGREYRKDIHKLAVGMKIPVEEMTGQGKIMGGKDLSQARAKYRDIIRKFESSSI